MEMNSQSHTPDEVLVRLGAKGPEIRVGYGGQARMN